MVCPNSMDFRDVLSGRSTHGTKRWSEVGRSMPVLDGPEISRAPIDQGRFGASQ
jgi:hypothetical protein